MKRRSPLLLAALAALALAATPAPGGARAAAPAAEGGVAAADGLVLRLPDGSRGLRRILDADVVNAAGKKLGTLQDLIADSDGRLTHGIVGVGGLLGVGETRVAVPYDRLKLRRRGDRWQATMSQEELRALPPFDGPGNSADGIAAERQAMAEAMADWHGRMRDHAGDAADDRRAAGPADGDMMGEAWNAAQAAWDKVKAATKDTWKDAKAEFDTAMSRLDRAWREGPGGASPGPDGAR